MVSFRAIIAWVLLCLINLDTQPVSAGTTQEWKERTIYQLLTDRFAKNQSSSQACSNLRDYCGGTFQGIINNIDYISGMGFDAIWISPVVDNTPGGYHGYWARNWNKINSFFGSQSDLKALVDACHERDIWIMVDVVANHVGPVGDDFSTIVPFNNHSYYHADCEINNWNDQNQVENCRLSGLPDLAQLDNPDVGSFLINWIKTLVNTYGFDGIRIDTVPEVPRAFWSQYAQAAGVFQIGEVDNGNPAYVGPYQQVLTGVLNYPMFYTIRDVFGGQQSMFNIPQRINQTNQYFTDLDACGLFVDNHDNPRFLNQYNNNIVGFKSALAYSLTGQGVPIYYYGSAQAYNGGDDPYNRPSIWQDLNKTNTDIYIMTQKINAAKKATKAQANPFTQRYVADNLYIFSRGDMTVALTNTQNDQQYTLSNHPYSVGQTVCNIFWSGDCVKVTQSGMDVQLNNGEVKVYIPSTLL